MNLLEFLDETYLAKTRRIGLLYGENCIILTSTLFDWSTVWRTDGQAEGRCERASRWDVVREIRCVGEITNSATVSSAASFLYKHRPNCRQYKQSTATDALFDCCYCCCCEINRHFPIHDHQPAWENTNRCIWNTSRWPLRHAALLDNYRQMSQNEAFSLVKCIRRYVWNWPLIILVLVWRNWTSRSTFDWDTSRNLFLRFRSQWS